MAHRRFGQQRQYGDLLQRPVMPATGEAERIPAIVNKSDDSPGISNEELESDLRSPMLSRSDLLYAHNSHDTIVVQKNNGDIL